ncbi:MAG: ArsB/NhaD family transporter [Eggerthellaceae bacterium]|nr:ArsB/NhaD family transporter [Eggerthellaceae bacterium]
MLTAAQILSIVVFVVVMALVVSEKIHRAVAALAGAVVLLIVSSLSAINTGVVEIFPSFDAALESIDFNTLAVLCGMMMFVGVVKLSGLFEYVAIKSAKLCKGDPWKIMVVFAIITAVFSAFLDNVTTILLIGPMTIMLCRTLKIDATPFLMVEILSSNVGGTATLIGDPPNIMIGSAAGLTFFDFIKYDAPAVVMMMVVIIVVFKFLYGKKLHVHQEDMDHVMELDENEAIKDRFLFRVSIAMIAVVTVSFMAHGALNLESGVIALAAAAIILLISRADLEEVIHDVEWPTIGFFLGLFIVVGGMEHTGVIEMIGTWMVEITGGNIVLLIVVLLWGSAILSAILDNIPFVATMIPIIAVMQSQGVDVAPLWWALSLGACLGGNGTLVGASANVVLSSIANREGYPISFMSFTKVGFPIMIITIIVATVYMLALNSIGWFV